MPKTSDACLFVTALFGAGLLLVGSLWACRPAAAAELDEYQPGKFVDGDQTLLYRLLSPKQREPGKKYPLVLFLHGAGERGDDNQAQLKHVVGIFVTPENREKYPCFVLAPQCPAGRKWAEVDWSAPTHRQPENPSAPMALTLKLIDQLVAEEPIDPARCYVMGLSMGGYGTWDVLARQPERFAAAVPMCGGGDETTAERIAHIPIWNFHGDKDPAVRVERSRRMVEALRAAGSKVKYTEYAGCGHDCWTPACKEPELLPWLFSQKKAGDPPR